MDGQITMFEIMEQMKIPDWAKEIVRGLKEHCKKWEFDWLDKLQYKKTSERFYQLFCHITRTYYIEIGEHHYNVEFSKDGNIVIKRCGPDWSKRGEDAIIRIEEVLEQL